MAENYKVKDFVLVLPLYIHTYYLIKSVIHPQFAQFHVSKIMPNYR